VYEVTTTTVRYCKDDNALTRFKNGICLVYPWLCHADVDVIIEQGKAIILGDGAFTTIQVREIGEA